MAQTDFVYPEDEGTGAYSSGEGDDDDAANFAWLAHALGLGPTVVEGFDLTLDPQVPDLDITDGKALVEDDDAVATQTGETRDGVLYGVGKSGEDAIALSDGTVNDVYLTIDLTASGGDSPSFEVFTSGSPTDPNLKIAEVDTAEDTVVPLNRNPDARFTAVNGVQRVSGPPRTGARIQAALDVLKANGGGELILGPGQWTVENTLVAGQEIVMSGTGLETELMLADGANVDMVRLPNGSNWFGLRNMFLTGNKANNSSGSGIVVGENCYSTRFENITISEFPGTGWTGTAGTTPALEPQFVNVYSQYNGLHGYRMVNVGDVSAFNIYAEGNGEHGILDEEGFNTYVHPHGYDNAKNGMSITGRRSQVLGGHMENNLRRGIQVKGDLNSIVGTLFYNNSQDGAEVYDAIQCDGASRTVITGVVSVDDQSTTTTRYLFTDVNGANRTHVMNHTVEGHDTLPALSEIGTESTVNGWAREDLGTSPTSAPGGAYRVGDMVWNQNADNDEMWVRVLDGSYKQFN